MNDESAQEGLLTANDAVRRLGIGRQTLYAYVSRGLIRSVPVPGSRKRLYRRADIDALAARREQGRSPARIAQSTLDWGAPVLESALTAIVDGRLYYRGVDAVALAATATLEDVAQLLWGDPAAGAFGAANLPPMPTLPPKRLTAFAAIDRCLAAAALAAPEDRAALDLTPAGVARTGARLLRLMTAASIDAGPSAEPVHRQLARGWHRPAAADAIRAALVLCADHELNASAFTVRCAASTAATPYAALVAGLAALQGPRHGGATRRVEDLLDTPAVARDPEAAVADRLRLGESLPGFGHALYPEGDPRAVALLDRAAQEPARAADLKRARAVAAAALALTGARPNLDFGLTVLARQLSLPAGAPLVLFLVGRTVGWIAHALEQYATGRIIRPRARYIGPPAIPAAGTPAADR